MRFTRPTSLNNISSSTQIDSYTLRDDWRRNFSFSHTHGLEWKSRSLAICMRIKMLSSILLIITPDLKRSLPKHLNACRYQCCWTLSEKTAAISLDSFFFFFFFFFFYQVQWMTGQPARQTRPITEICMLFIWIKHYWKDYKFWHTKQLEILMLFLLVTLKDYKKHCQ